MMQDIPPDAPADMNSGTGPHRVKPLRLVARALVWAILVLMAAWGVLAIFYSNLPPRLRPVSSALFAAAACWALFFARPRSRWRLIFLVAFAALAAWWAAIPASNDRDWAPDVAVLPSAVIDGDEVTIRNIRNFEYRSTTDFDVRYYDRTFDLAKLTAVDLILSQWGTAPIGHTMLSFGFEGDEYVCISIEARKQKGEKYSPLKGLFKQNELIYVVADERDAVRVRANYREEKVYLYRLKAHPDVIRKGFLDYLEVLNSLRTRPAWYHTLLTNCTTTIRGHTKPYAADSAWNWRILINGYVDELAYRKGTIDRSLPFAELKKRSLINARAAAADDDPGFSKRIREGLPGIEEPLP